MIYGGPGQCADDRMMDFYFFRKEREGMISESCRSLCYSSRLTQAHTGVDKGGYVRMYVHVCIAPGRVLTVSLMGFRENVPQATKRV